MKPNDTLERPLQLAIRSLRLLGAASAVWGFVFVFVWGYFNKFERFRIPFIVMGLVVWGIPGVLFFLCGWMMQKDRLRSAALWAMAITVAQGLIAIAALIASVTFPPVSPIPILLCVMWVAALIQLFGHLRRSLPLLEHDTLRHHGFDVTERTPMATEVATPLKAVTPVAPVKDQSIDSLRVK